MKKFKNFGLGIVGATLLIVGLVSCTNDESNKTIENGAKDESIFKSKTSSNLLIANYSDHKISLLFDKNDLEASLISEGIFAEVESIEIEEGFLTIIGKDIDSFKLQAFQVELIKTENEYYYPNPEDTNLPVTTFATHECDGDKCSSCSFLYATKPNGKRGNIIGCDCNDTGSCDHKMIDKDKSDKNKETAKTILEILKSIF